MKKNIFRIALLGLLYFFVLYLYNAYTSIMYPYQIDYGEGPILNHIRLFLKGCTIYKAIGQYPYIVGNYPPVYALLCAIFAKFFGISFAIGRLISVVSTLLIGILIYKIVRPALSEERAVVKGRKQAAIIAALLFFASPHVYSWSCLHRVDMLGLLFTITGLYIVLSYENDKKAYWSIIPFLLGLFTKQTFFIAPTACFIYLFLKDRKTGAKMGIYFVFTYICLFIALDFFTHGQFFLHTVVLNANIFNIGLAVNWYVYALRTLPFIFGFALAYTLYSLYKKQLSLPVVYFILSVFMAFSVGKIGSSVNYMLELIAAACILSGLLLNKLCFENENIDNIAAILAGALILIQLLILPHPLFMNVGAKSGIDINAAEKASAYVLEAEVPVLSEDIGLLVLNGKDVLFEPFIFTQLYRQKMWNPEKFINDIKNNYFSLIILQSDATNRPNIERFTEEMIEAVNSAYYLADKVGSYCIFKPRSVSDAE